MSGRASRASARRKREAKQRQQDEVRAAVRAFVTDVIALRHAAQVQLQEAMRAAIAAFPLNPSSPRWGGKCVMWDATTTKQAH